MELTLTLTSSPEENTHAINEAIRACSDEGGGTVTLPAGQWQTGTLYLQSHVTLHLERGCHLTACGYDTTIPKPVEAPQHAAVMLYAADGEDIGLEGFGSLDERSFREGFRPMLLRFERCRGVTLRDVTLLNAGAWCAHMVECEDILCDNVHIFSVENPNNDGFDMDGCRNVTIRNCRVEAGDDAVCLKSTRRPCENVVITGCILQSTTAAVKLGTSSRGGFRNVVLSDCVFHHCQMGAIKLLLVDGGVLEHITVHNILMDDVEGPLFVRLGDRGNKFETAEEMHFGAPNAQEAHHEEAPGYLRDVNISDLTVRVKNPAYDTIGMLISGIPGRKIQRLRLENIDMELPGGYPEPVAVMPPEDPARYPEQSFFGVLPSSVLYLRHAEDVCIRNFAVRFAAHDARPPFVFEDAEGCRMEHVTVDGKEVAASPAGRGGVTL